MNRTRIPKVHRPRGFTIVELLIVMTIITLLMGISIAALRGAIGAAREKQTQATILKVHGLVQQRVEAFNRALDKMNLTAAKQKMRVNFNTTYGNATNIYLRDNSKVLEVLARKQLFQSRFPQNFAERNLLGGALPPPTPHQPVTQSSALLYWLLTSSEVFGIAPVDSSEFSSAEVRDTDGDGLKEFVDGWGRPLRFYRWPTMLFCPIGSGAVNFSTTGTPYRPYVSALWSGLPAHPPEDINGNNVLDAGEDLNGNGVIDNFDIDPLNRDPDDPTAQMFQLASQDTSNTIMIGLQDLFHTPSVYNAFLIVSAGPDGVLGLCEPFDCNGTNDPTQVPIMTTTWPALWIPNSPMVTSPALGVPQGRLAAFDPTYPLSLTTFDQHPVNDNLTNRKR